MTKGQLTPAQIKRLAGRIKAAREALGMTQQEAANGAKVLVGSWAKWEQGQFSPSLASLVTIARVVRVTTGELLD